MKVLVALVAALVGLAAAHHGGIHGYNGIPDMYEGQREYVYNWRSLVATGLPTQGMRYAGLEKYGVLTVQVREQQGSTKVLGLKLGHVMSGSFDKEVEDVENRRIEGVTHGVEENIEKYGPVFVKIQDNEVQKLKAPQDMPEEIINVYRGIASIFTVGKPQGAQGEKSPFMKEQQYGTDEPIVYRRQEEGIKGNYETIYQILSNPEQQEQLNVTKTLNHLKHFGQHGRFFQNGHDARGCQNVCPTHKPEQLDRNMQPELADWMKPTAEGCPVHFHPKTDLVETFTTYNYNMTVQRNGKVAIIDQAQALGKKILPLRKQQIKTLSLIKLNLVEERPISQTWNQQEATKQYDELTYRFPEGHKFDLKYLSLYNKAENYEMLKDQIMPMIKALSQIIAADNIELQHQTGDKIVQLTMALGALNKRELQNLWTALGETATKDKNPTELDRIQRKVLVDTIALSGSNNASEFLLDLIHQQKLSTLETVHTLESFQKNLVMPTPKVMNQILAILTDGKFQEKRTILSAAGIAFAEIVRESYGHKTHQRTQGTHEGGHIGEQEYRQFVEAIRGQLHSAKDFSQQTIFIQTLGRLAHPEAIKALIPYVYGEPEVVAQIGKMTGNDKHEDNSEYMQFIRQVAIHALHHSAKEHGSAVQPIVQAIYFNKQEDYELRIAAFSVLVATQPTEATFGRIVLELGKEQDLEVASYTYSALRSLVNTTVPCMQQTARRVWNVIGALPEKTFGVHHSKWVARTHYSPLANFGLKGHWELTQSNVSAIPRAMYAGLTANKGPFVSTVGDFGFIAKGFENLHQLLRQKGGMNKIVENVMQRIRRDARGLSGDASVEQLIQEIERTMQFNTEENNEQARAVVFGNLLGHEAYLPIDKEYISKVAQKAGERLVKLLREEAADKTFRFVRILMPRTYVQVAPGVNGLPIVLTNRHPIVVSLALKDLKTRFGGAEKGQMKLHPFGLAVSGVIRPTVYHTSIHSAFVINTVEQTRQAYGVRATEQTYITFPLDVSVQYTHQTKTFGLTLRPRFEKIFLHKTRAVTFKTEALLIRGAEMPILDRYTVLKTQQKPFVFDRTFGEKLGMALRVKGMSMNEEYAVNFLRSRIAREKNVMTALIKEISNQWFIPRTWAVNVDDKQDKPLQEIKMVIRVGNLLKNRMFEQEGRKQPHQKWLSQEQLVKEQAYPEEMRMIAYEQEFEKIVGRKPHAEELEQALQRIAQKTEKYWSQVDRELHQKLNKENTQVRSLEYVIAAKGEKKPLAISGHLVFASTLPKQIKLAEIKMDVEKRPISFQAQIVAATTKAPQPFESEVAWEQQHGIVGFVAELETRQTGKQQYSGKIEMTKSEEQKQLMKGDWQQKPWYYRQCAEDKKERLSEMSTACEMVRYHKSALNQLRFEIELPQQIHERLYNASHQIRETLKVRLYRNLRANYVAQNQENKIQGQLVYSEQYPEMRMVNLTIRTPDHEELHFERVAVPKAIRPNVMWSLKEQAKAFLKQDRPEPTCVYNGRHMRTFDNVTIDLHEMKEGVKHVMARDNNEKPKFTILVEKKQGGEKTDVEILLRDATVLKLTPPAQQNVYHVRVNSTKTLQVTPKKTEVHQYGPQTKHMITMHVEEHKEGQDTLVIKVRDQRLRIVYDGKNLKIENAKLQSKGQLTGLCGDMNNQHIDELTGPRGCNFEREEDFVRAFALVKESRGMEGRWWCPEGVYPRGASQQDMSEHQKNRQLIHDNRQRKYEQHSHFRGEDDLITEETMLITINGKTCFSNYPVRVCKEGAREVKTTSETVDFTCFNEEHPRTAQLQRELQATKIIRDLPIAGGKGHIYRTVQVPLRCAN